MGMAATQARLLTLTNRKNMIGYDLTMLSAQKMALAREADKVSLDYNEALNEKRLKWSNDAGATMYDLSYDTLMQPSQLNCYEPYMITDMSGKVVVDNNYLKYAQLISPNGAPGGNYDGNRSEILAGLLGMERNEFLAQDIHNAEVRDLEALIAAHKKKEPKLVEDTAMNVLSGLGNVTGDAITAKTGAVGDDASDVTADTTWGDIVKSINNGDNYVTYLHYNKDKTKSAADMNAEFKRILEQFGSHVKKYTKDFEVSEAAYKNAIDKTYQLFTSKYEFEGSDSNKKKMVKAGENADNVNTMSHWHDKSNHFIGIKTDGGGDAYAVSLTNMANVFLGYLFDTANAEEKIKSNNPGTYTIDLNKTTLTTTESRTAYDEWQKQLEEYEAQLGTKNEKYIEPFDSEIQKKIDFYDAIFNAIAKFGWTHNEHINDNEYLNDVLQTGLYNITQAEEKAHGWEYDESVPTTCQNIFQVSDSNEIAKITAEYERDKTKINRKEEAIDVKMQKLETEQSAISQMLESYRTMIDDNIDRTFNTFG